MTDPKASFPFSLLGLMWLCEIHLLSHFPSAQEDMGTLGKDQLLRCLPFPNPFTFSLISALKQSHISPPLEEVHNTKIIPTLEK